MLKRTLLIFFTILSTNFAVYAIDKSLLPKSITDPFKSYSGAQRNNDISTDGDIRLSGIIIRIPNDKKVFSPSQEVSTPLTYYYFDPSKEKIDRVAKKFRTPLKLLKTINSINNSNTESKQTLLIPAGLLSKVEIQKALMIDISINNLLKDYLVTEEQIIYLKNNQLLGIGSIITTDLQKPFIVEEMQNAKTIAEKLKMSVEQLFDLNPFLLDEPASTIGMVFEKKTGLILNENNKLVYRTKSQSNVSEAANLLMIDKELIQQINENSFEIDIKKYLLSIRNNFNNPHFFSLVDITNDLTQAHFLSDSIGRNSNAPESGPDVGWKIGYSGVSASKSSYFKVEFGPFNNKSGAEQFCNSLSNTNKGCIVVSELLDKKLNAASNYINSVVVLNQDEKFLVLDNEDKGYAGISINAVEKSKANIKIAGKIKELELKSGKIVRQLDSVGVGAEGPTSNGPGGSGGAGLDVSPTVNPTPSIPGVYIPGGNGQGSDQTGGAK